MLKAVTSVEIAGPILDVFGYMSDLNNTEWTVGLIEVRHDGNLRQGAEGVDVRLMGRKPVEMPWKVTTYEPPNRVVFQYQDPFPVTADFRLDQVGRGTRVTCETTLRPRGLLWLLGPLMVRETRKTDRAQFDRLKEILESRRVGDPPV